MVIRIDDYEVIRDGVLVVNSSNRLLFEIEDLSFEFVFKTDESGKKSIRHERTEDKLVIYLVNFNNNLGTGLSNPIEVATLDSGEILFVLFAVHAISDNLRVFHYTWVKRRHIEEGGKNE